MPELTLERLDQIEKDLVQADKEIHSILETYYSYPNNDGVSGRIGEIYVLHSENVDALAEARRKLKEKKK